MCVGLDLLVFELLFVIHFLMGHRVCVCAVQKKKKQHNFAASSSFANIEQVRMNFTV